MNHKTRVSKLEASQAGAANISPAELERRKQHAVTLMLSTMPDGRTVAQHTIERAAKYPADPDLQRQARIAELVQIAAERSTRTR